MLLLKDGSLHPFIWNVETPETRLIFLQLSGILARIAKIIRRADVALRWDGWVKLKGYLYGADTRDTSRRV